MGMWLLVLLSGYYLLMKKANCESSTEGNGIQAVVTHNMQQLSSVEGDQ